MKKERNYQHYSYAIIFAFLLLRILYIATTHYNLIADEAYFWDWSRHPALSYYDQGPMVAWIIRFFTTLLPLSEFSVRLGAPVFSALTALVAFRLAQKVLQSAKKAFVFILLFHLTPIATAGGVIMTYYAPQVLFMALTAFFLWRLIEDRRGFWWYWIGLSLGLGLLSHHMFSVFSAEVALFVILSKNNRRWLLRKEPYIALIIELAVASPIFIWNATSEAVMARHAVGLLSLSPKAALVFLEFLGGQAMTQSPLLFLAAIAGISVSGYRGIRYQDDTCLFLFCLSAPMLLFIALLCFGGRTEANWPVSAYITGGIAAISVVYEFFEKGSSLQKQLIKAGLYFTIIFGFLIFIVASYPQTLSAIGLAIPPKKDPANRLYGWEELGREVTSIVATMPPGSFISTRDYGDNALVAFYTMGNPQVFEIPDGRRMSQYDFWNDSIPTLGRDAVFVDRNPIRKQTKKLFERVELVKHLIIRTADGRHVRREFYIYKAFGYKGNDVKADSF
jgi:4-amino-4-deoxy-L-arabinose transferase-like glycosyltransferase